MPFNSITDRSAAAPLINEQVSAEIMKYIPEQSAVMQMAKRLPNMSTNQTRLPVLASLPTAYFVNGDTGLKQTTSVEWSNKYIDAEELAVIVPIPEALIDDSSYDVQSEIIPLLAEAFGAAIDKAVLFGTNIPASWTTNLGAAGLLARATAAGQTVSLAAYTDFYEAVLGKTGGGALGVNGLLHEDGFMATGHIAHPEIATEITNCRDSNGQPIFFPGANAGTNFATGTLNGARLMFPLNDSIDETQALMFSGAWNKLFYSVRRDITIKKFDTGILQDAGGNITMNLLQQDMIAVRAVMRIGFALPNPINRMNTNAVTRCPFAVLTA